MISRRAFVCGTAALGGTLSMPADAHQSVRVNELLDRAMDGIDPKRFIDAHNHVVGVGHGGSGCAVHPSMTDGIRHPLNWVRFHAYARASGIESMDAIDQEYMDKLKERVEGMPHAGTHLLFAFDRVYTESGIPDADHTVFYVPNDHMLRAVAMSERFAACASIHPFRPDAIDELHRMADAGAVAIKWLPNAMWIDPADPRCIPFYEAMVARQLTLISHGGEEQAVPSPHTQEYGNPLRLRLPLQVGVQVVVAHCASFGKSRDLDHPTAEPVPSFELFLRLMDEPSWQRNLYGELSAVLLFNRVRGVVDTLLRRTDLHPRLIHGSDYPIPGIDPLINLVQLWSLGLIRWSDRAPLAHLFHQNPLLGDFALKRVLTVDGGPPVGFPPNIFCPDDAVFPRLTRPA
ncbi:MAG: amidohydrolase [Myxococcota bacterium]|nr:amidohydrolase [Myxococcota bacterium]